jgi:hypothetical protein
MDLHMDEDERKKILFILKLKAFHVCKMDLFLKEKEMRKNTE